MKIPVTERPKVQKHFLLKDVTVDTASEPIEPLCDSGDQISVQVLGRLDGGEVCLEGSLDGESWALLSGSRFDAPGLRVLPLTALTQIRARLYVAEEKTAVTCIVIA